MTDSPLDRDLDEMAGTPQLARAVKQSLERLRTGSAGPGLAEMASEVLEGRTDLRGIARSSAYADQISAGITGFKSWEAELTDGERTHLEEEADRVIYGEADPQ